VEDGTVNHLLGEVPGVRVFGDLQAAIGKYNEAGYLKVF